MPTVVVYYHSGLTGTPGKEYTFTATKENFERVFPYDLKSILEMFLPTLAVDTIYAKFIPQPSTGKYIMIVPAGIQQTSESAIAEIAVDFIIEKPRPLTDAYDDASSADYTLNRLRQLLIANNKFGGNVGVLSLDSISVVTGLEYSSLTETSYDVEGGLLRAVWSILSAPLNRAD